MELVFEKILTQCDIIYGRLCYRAGHLELLPFEGQRTVEFHVSYQIEPPRLFRYIRREGPFAQPTISRGWVDIVRDKRLMVGDRLETIMGFRLSYLKPLVVHGGDTAAG